MATIRESVRRLGRLVIMTLNRQMFCGSSESPWRARRTGGSLGAGTRFVMAAPSAAAIRSSGFESFPSPGTGEGQGGG